jgi:5-methylcytosine-specific restriction protein A
VPWAITAYCRKCRAKRSIQGTQYCNDCKQEGKSRENKRKNWDRKDKLKWSRYDRELNAFYSSAAWIGARNDKRKCNPLCEECLENSLIVPMAEVDHIVPIRDGGERLDPTNLRSLCKSCHSKKSSKESRKMKSFITKLKVVVGPPFAGKSTYINSKAEPGDMVLDVDRIVRALNLEGKRDNDFVLFAVEMRNAALIKLERFSSVKVAWMPITTVKVDKLQEWKAKGAEIIAMVPTEQEVLERLKVNDTRIKTENDRRTTARLVQDWYATNQELSTWLRQ